MCVCRCMNTLTNDNYKLKETAHCAVFRVCTLLASVQYTSFPFYGPTMHPPDGDHCNLHNCKGSHVPITYIPALHTRSSVIIDELWAWFWTVVYMEIAHPFELVLMLALTFAPSIHFWHNILLIIYLYRLLLLGSACTTPLVDIFIVHH